MDDRLHATTLGDLVVEHPAAARVLERFGLDYCCRGGRTLDEACEAADLDAIAVADALRAAQGSGEEADWAQLPAPELADHVVATHHQYLHEELPLLDALSEKVLRVHGGRHPELEEVRALFVALRADLEPHLMKEELVLFPAVHALARGETDFHFGSVENPIRMMRVEHDRAGDLLERLRAISSSYTVPDDGCASYRSLYERLAALEHDTHVHIHKENHVLFPAAIARADELGRSARRAG